MSEELWEKQHKEWIKNMFVKPNSENVDESLWNRMNEMVGSYYSSLPILVNQEPSTRILSSDITMGLSPQSIAFPGQPPHYQHQSISPGPPNHPQLSHPSANPNISITKNNGQSEVDTSGIQIGGVTSQDANISSPPSGKNGFQCQQCSMMFSNRSAYTSHIRSHNKTGNTTPGQDPYQCDVCKKTFAVPARLVRHYRTHTGERPFECEFCHKMFSVKENLQVHRRIHTKERPYKCEVCGRAFEHSGKLHRHMRIHTGERPHKCTVCGKTFIQSGQLVIHLRTHTGEKPYRCNVEGCGKGFTCSKQLKVHSRTHTGEKPYHCDICFRDFGYNHVLKLHRVQHYGSKCYKCTICDETFKNKKDMEAHIKGHANDIPDQEPSAMSPNETDSSNASTTSSNKENKLEDLDNYYIYQRFEPAGVNPVLLAAAAAAAASEERAPSPKPEMMETEPLVSPVTSSGIDSSMYMYESLNVMRQHAYFAPQVPEYLPNLDKANDIVRRVEAAIAVASADTMLTPPSTTPEQSLSPSRSTSPDEVMDLMANRDMMTLPPRKRKMYLKSIETPVVNTMRMSSVIQFAKAS